MSETRKTKRPLHEGDREILRAYDRAWDFRGWRAGDAPETKGGLDLPRAILVAALAMSTISCGEEGISFGELVKEYHVYRTHEDSNFIRIDVGGVLERVYIDSLDGGPSYDATNHYYIVAVDHRDNEGENSEIISVDIRGNSQGWVSKTPIKPLTEAFSYVVSDELYCAGGKDELSVLSQLLEYLILIRHALDVRVMDGIPVEFVVFLDV